MTRVLNVSHERWVCQAGVTLLRNGVPIAALHYTLVKSDSQDAKHRGLSVQSRGLSGGLWAGYQPPQAETSYRGTVWAQNVPCGCEALTLPSGRGPWEP